MLSEDDGSGIPNYCYGYAAQAVEVEVDTLTGQVRVTRVISVHDVGRAVNMQQVEGQIEGCLAQAVGYALLEELKTRDGIILTPHLSTYLLPTALDMPEEIVPVVTGAGGPARAVRRARSRRDAARAVPAGGCLGHPRRGWRLAHRAAIHPRAGAGRALRVRGRVIDRVRTPLTRRPIRPIASTAASADRGCQPHARFRAASWHAASVCWSSSQRAAYTLAGNDGHDGRERPLEPTAADHRGTI